MNRVYALTPHFFLAAALLATKTDAQQINGNAAESVTKY